MSASVIDIIRRLDAADQMYDDIQNNKISKEQFTDFIAGLFDQTDKIQNKINEIATKLKAME